VSQEDKTHKSRGLLGGSEIKKSVDEILDDVDVAARAEGK
jgi:hypothetical protein